MIHLIHELPAQPGYNATQGESMFDRERFAIHRVSKKRVGIERLLQWNRSLKIVHEPKRNVGSIEKNIDCRRLYTCTLQHIRQAELRASGRFRTAAFSHCKPGTVGENERPLPEHSRTLTSSTEGIFRKSSIESANGVAT